jgi:hypothetical protein
MVDAILHSTCFSAVIMGVEVEVKLTIWDTFEATFDFSMQGSPYTFVIRKWSRQGFAKFATLFFSAAPRDAMIYGSFSEATDGHVNFSMDTAQKINIIEQGVKDILICIDKIGCHYQRCILDYAVWYRENHPETETYEQYVTRVACCAMVNAEFLAPNINWEIVRFSLTTS